MVSSTTQTVSDAAQLKIVPLIAKELGVGPDQVKAAVALLDEGSTVPFIALCTARVIPECVTTRKRE